MVCVCVCVYFMKCVRMGTGCLGEFFGLAGVILNSTQQRNVIVRGILLACLLGWYLPRCVAVWSGVSCEWGRSLGVLVSGDPHLLSRLRDRRPPLCYLLTYLANAYLASLHSIHPPGPTRRRVSRQQTDTRIVPAVCSHPHTKPITVPVQYY